MEAAAEAEAKAEDPRSEEEKKADSPMEKAKEETSEASDAAAAKPAKRRKKKWNQVKIMRNFWQWQRRLVMSYSTS